MTQALAAEEILRNAGHRVTTIHLGTSDRRAVPAFFRRRTRARVETFRSPILVPDREDRGMSASATAVYNAARMPLYVREALRLGRSLRREKPDVAVNFFDLLGATAFVLFRPGRLRLAVAHHFLAGHSEAPRPAGAGVGWWALRLLTALCGLGAHRRLALSLRPVDSGIGRPRVIPPLLRSEVLNAIPREGEHVQVYVLNPGYGAELESWHREHRDVKVEAFWDRNDVPQCLELHPNLRFHRIHDRKFVEGLRTCRALATTAGFESVCEAMYLGKPILLVPTRGHVEQAWNAADAVRAGAGIRRDSFAMDDLLELVRTTVRPPGDSYRSWVLSAPSRLLAEVEAS